MNLPKRSATELAQALRDRASRLCGAEWEVLATAAMMREAAALLSVHNTPAEWAMVRATLDAEAAGVSPFDLREASRVAVEDRQ